MTTFKRLVPMMLALLSVCVCAEAASDLTMRDAAKRVLNSTRHLERVAYYPGMAVYRQSGGGFAIVSSGGDSRVLAYSRTASLDLSDVNPGFNWWLNATRKVIMQSAPRLETTKPDPTRFPREVKPLLTTTWGQREPFKFMCPFDKYVLDFSLYGTYAPDSGHYSVGCGPLAMAQYMNFYKFPRHGVGEESVTVKYDQGNVTLTVDFESSTYDWDQMIDDYQGYYTSRQGMAVARLCYDCGVAAQTTWNNLGGGTTDERILNAFINHFNYNDTAHYIPRSRYDEPTWMEYVYSILSSGNPILYSAKDINLELGIIAGHNFIIDGYDENGLIHVNWGWYGIENGYFDIALLHVFDYTYDDWQAMYVGLYPNRETIVGDIDQDGSITIADVIELIDMILTKTQSPAADIDGDGEITVGDVTDLIDMLLGM